MTARTRRSRCSRCTSSNPPSCSSTRSSSRQILNEPEWDKRLTDRDRKALTALTWAHINPYRTFHMDMSTHLDLGPGNPNVQAA
jgi:hypothetical protein